MSSRRIIRTYLAIAATTTLAQSLIWGVNTLFLLSVGLDIFEVMLVNASFTVAQMVFEVPTGVIADTLGRRVSYLLSVVIVLVSTLLYVWLGSLHAGVGLFALASVVLGLGFTFYTGAVDAWMVDALHSVGYTDKLDPVFARYGMVFGASMLVGATAGGFLGQVELWIPYVARAAILVPAFLIGLLAMPELGFKGRPLRVSRFAEETRRIARAGVSYGLRDRVVRLLMAATFVQGLWLFYGFYSWQKYFLDLLDRDLVWVAGVIAAFVGLSQIAGNALVGPLSRRIPDRSTILLAAFGVETAGIVGAALTGEFYVAVTLYLVSMVAFGVLVPVKQSWINQRIPSEQRATIISLDSLFGDGGSTVGQVGLGYVSQAVSIPVAWLIGGLSQAAALPLVARAGRVARAEKRRDTAVAGVIAIDADVDEAPPLRATGS